MVSESFAQRPKEIRRSRRVARGFGFSSSVSTMKRAASISGTRARAGMAVQHLHRRIAKAALRHVDDALEGEIVGGLVDDAQIGERIADFGALVEARAADDAIGHAERHEPIFDFAHLAEMRTRIAISESECFLACSASISSPMRRASSSESQAPVIETFSPGSSSVRRVLPRRPWFLAMRPEAAERICAGGAVIALQPDHRRAGKIVLEAQDVVDLGAAPAIDRLVVVADAAEVARLSQQAQPGTGRRWCPDSRPPACNGNGSDTARGYRGARATGAGIRAGGRRNRPR